MIAIAPTKPPPISQLLIDGELLSIFSPVTGLTHVALVALGILLFDSEVWVCSAICF